MKELSLEANVEIRNETKGGLDDLRVSSSDAFLPGFPTYIFWGNVEHREMVSVHTHLLPGPPLPRIGSSCQWNHKWSSDSAMFNLGRRCPVPLLFKNNRFQWSFSSAYMISPPATLTQACVISFLATSDPHKSQPHSGDLSNPGEIRDERVSSKSQSSNRLSR